MDKLMPAAFYAGLIKADFRVKSANDIWIEVYPAGIIFVIEPAILFNRLVVCIAAYF